MRIHLFLVAAFLAVFPGLVTAQDEAEPAFVPPVVNPSTIALEMEYLPGVLHYLRRSFNARSIDARIGISSTIPQTLVQFRGYIYEDGSPDGLDDPVFCLSADATATPPTCSDQPVSLDQHESSIFLRFDEWPQAPGQYTGRFVSMVTPVAADGSIAGDPPAATAFAIPFTLNVRHAPLLPVVVLFVGLIIGGLLSWYRTQQRDLDELHISVDKLARIALEAGFGPDKDAAKAFWEQIRIARAALVLRGLEAAQAAYDEAEKAFLELSRDPSDVRMLGHRPEINPADVQAQAKDARTRFYVFFITSYAIALFMLGYVGLQELYFGDPDFGKLADYFTLLLWGFGSQATGDAVGRLVGSWNLGVIARES